MNKRVYWFRGWCFNTQEGRIQEFFPPSFLTPAKALIMVDKSNGGFYRKGSFAVVDIEDLYFYDND